MYVTFFSFCVPMLKVICFSQSLNDYFIVMFSMGQDFKIHTLIVDVSHCLQVSAFAFHTES